MSDSYSFAPVVLGFLLTYLIHSTVIIGGTGLLVCRFKRFRHSALRVLAWKQVIILPLLTTGLVTFCPFPHLGLQFVLCKSPSPNAVSPGGLSLPLVDNAQEFGSGELFSDTDNISDEAKQAVVYRDVADEKTLRIFDQTALHQLYLLFTILWIATVILGIVRLCIHARRLRDLRAKSTPVTVTGLQHRLIRIAQKMQVRQDVELLEHAEVSGALTAGIWHPYIVVQAQRDGNITGRDLDPEWEALLAHELAHVAHRDAAWNLLVQIVLRLFPFQPLNRIAGRQLQIAMDFAADRAAAKVLGGQAGLIRCLVRLGDQMLNHRPTHLFTGSGLVAGMVAFRSTLGQRVEQLLHPSELNLEFTRAAKVKVLSCMTICAISLATLVPQTIAWEPIYSPESHVNSIQGNTMKSQLSVLAVLIGLSATVDAQETQESTPAVQQAVELKKTPDELPPGIKQFNGMLVGRLAAKDVEKGSFVVVVDAVPRVWRNSKAENPKSLLGKSVEIQGVFGKFLDVLVTTRIGETVEFECKHDGEALVFPGELLRKVGPYQADDYPVLPEEFRGFQGTIVADVKKKDPETFELIVEVQKVGETQKESNAKQPESIVGKTAMLTGFWNRKEAYHKLKVGDQVNVEVQHIGRQSDHLTVAEFVRQADPAGMRETRQKTSAVTGQSSPIHGFRGMLVGRLVKKDVERGTFTITVDAVPRVWNNNQSRAPKSLIGQNVDAEGVPNQLLDALVVTRIGETIQFGALHDGEGSLRVGEVLRKVAPVEKGDYPELPDDFRGFSGILQAKVVGKDEQLLELTAEVIDVVRSFDKDQSRDAKSIVGKQVMLSGFWNKKDAYHSLSVGDKFQVGVEHPQTLGDQLSVIEGLRKLEN